MHRRHGRHAVAAALLASGHRHRLPVLLFFLGSLTGQAQHAAAGVQRLQAGCAHFSGFFDQPVHAFVGRHAQRQLHSTAGFAFVGAVRVQRHIDIAAAHAGDGGVPFAALAVEQRDLVARLQAQHLHMARRAFGQAERRTGGHGHIGKKASAQNV